MFSFANIKALIYYLITGRDYNMRQLLDRGLKVGVNLFLGSNCFIDPIHCWLITIGNNVVLAANVQIFAHDSSTYKTLKVTKLGKVTIGNNVYVGANTVILPNTKIGDYAVVGAGSVVSKDIPPASVAWGNPAEVKCTLEKYVEKHRNLIRTRPVYDKAYGFRQGIDEAKKKQMCKDLENNMGYIAY